MNHWFLVVVHVVKCVERYSCTPQHLSQSFWVPYQDVLLSSVVYWATNGSIVMVCRDWKTASRSTKTSAMYTCNHQCGLLVTTLFSLHSGPVPIWDSFSLTVNIGWNFGSKKFYLLSHSGFFPDFAERSPIAVQLLLCDSLDVEVPAAHAWGRKWPIMAVSFSVSIPNPSL